MTDQTSLLRETHSRSTDSQPSPHGESGASQLRRRFAATAAEGGGGGGGGSAIGLGDPFAEIFASIAAAETPVPQPPAASQSVSDDDKRPEPRGIKDDEKDEPRLSAETVAAAPVKLESMLDAEQSGEDSDVAPVSAAAVTATTDTDKNPGLGEENATAEPAMEGQTPVDSRSENLPIQTNQPDVAAGQFDVEPNNVADAGAHGERDRNRAEANEAETARAEFTVDEASTSDHDRLQPETKERSDASQEAVDQAAADERGEPSESRVERRRYSDSSERGRADDSHAPSDSQAHERSSSETDGATKPRVDANGEANRSSAATNPGGVDISGMTPVNASSPLGSVTTAAVNATQPQSVAAMKGSNAGVTAPTATSSGSTGGDAPSAFGLGSNAQSGREAKEAGGTKPSVGVDTSAAVERARLAQRVSRGFQHLGSGGGQIRMKLSPEHLGSVQLQMTLRDGKLNGKMVTQSEAAAEMLRDQLPGLRASLENQGIRLERIDIETETTSDRSQSGTDSRQSQDRSGGFADQQSARQQNFAGARYRNGWSDVNGTRRVASPATIAPLASLPILPGSVDLRV